MPEAKPYRILAEIGRGGMRVVFKAEDPRLARFVALKFVAPNHALGAEEATRRLLAEARAASALDHPNICTIFDVGETSDGRLFFAMPFYQGRTLAKWIEKKVRSRSSARRRSPFRSRAGSPTHIRSASSIATSSLRTYSSPTTAK